MKKTNFKIFKVGLAVAFLFCAANLFTACGKVALELESDIKQQLFATETYFVENVYAEEGSVDFNSDTLDSYVTNENYYVLISSNVKEEIDQIMLGNTLYGKDEEVTTRVSSANNIKRKAFITQDQKLYISSLLMFFNTGNDGDLLIKFPEGKYKDIKIEVYEENNTLNVGVKSIMEETLTTTDEENLKFDFRIDNPNGQAFIELKDGEQELASTTPVLIEVVANPARENQSLAQKFETPTTVAGVEGSGVVIPVGHNGGDEYEIGLPANHMLIYNIYVPQVGTKTITINFFNTMT